MINVTQKVTNRLVDLLVSCIVLIILSPLFFMIALAIKITSRGGVIYTQKRVGFEENTFQMYKFRSMISDAEKGLGPVWAAENDPRATSVGSILRNSGLDELPQLVNVLKGEMSLVGPRPERPYFVQKFKKDIPSYKKIFNIKPGITGWAQINWKYDDSLKGVIEKTKYDIYYVENMSLKLDLKILYSTLISLLKPGKSII